MPRAVVSFVGLQMVWFACVLGAAHGYTWLGPIVFVPVLAVHLRTQARGARRKELALLALAALAGFLVDTALLAPQRSRQRFDGQRLVQVFRADEGGTRTNELTLSPDGALLVMKATLSSPKLSIPVVYTLTYRRAE